MLWSAWLPAVSLLTLSASATAAPAQTTSSASASAPAAKYVIVFDFASKPAGDYGAQLADAVRIRLGDRREIKAVDGLTTRDLAPEGGLPIDASEAKVAALLKDKAGAHVAIFGAVEKSGQKVTATVRCVDITPGDSAAWTKTFTDSTERARGEIARQIVEALLGSPEWKPPEYGDEKEPDKFGRPLNVNGDFESGKAGWAGPDNVATFIVKDTRPGRSGSLLRIFTDLEREAWLKYQQDLRTGKADPDKPPQIGTVDNKYATVAGLEGVHYRGGWIDAKPLQRYWLTADMKAASQGMFFPKIFVKGFADFSASADGLPETSLTELKLTPDQFAALAADKQKELIAADARRHPDRYRREVYRWYLSCRNEGNQWRHYAAGFPPRGGLPKNVQWLRLEVYAYWPPGEYLFDDVFLYADPRQTGPAAEEPARTPKKLTIDN